MIIIKIILFGLLFFIILAVIMGFSLIKSFFKIVSASRKQGAAYQNERKDSHQEYSQQQTGKRKDKIYSKDDGEYIDFEEIKEDRKQNSDSDN